MLGFPGSLKVFIALDAVDMRAGANTLAALVAATLKEEVRGGALFVFTNKRRKLIKVLYFDGTGMWLMSKRLEAGTFYWPRAAEEGQLKLELAPEAFAMPFGHELRAEWLTDGIDMHGAKPRGWYERVR